MNTNTEIKLNHKRDPWLDHLRGATLVSMILYHGCWDLVYLLGFGWEWYKGTGAWLWQQSICWTFILLSGYCWPMGRHHAKRGLMTFGAGLLVSAVTIIAMPSSRIICGVLTLLGTSALLMIPLDHILRRVDPRAGLAVSFMLFLLFRSVNSGWLGIGLGGPLKGMILWELPETLYHRGLLGAWIGFMPKGFFSTDYFSVLPWFFLFCTGYFLRKKKELSVKSDWMDGSEKRGIRTKFCEGLGPVNAVLEWMGRHSLIVYLLHQPALYGITVILDFIL